MTENTRNGEMRELEIKLMDKKEAPAFFADVGRKIKLGYYRGSWYDGSTWRLKERK